MNDLQQTSKTILRKPPALEVLFTRAKHDTELYEKVLWLRDLVRWTRSPISATPSESELLNFETGEGQFTKVRYLMKVLDRNKEIRSHVSQLLHSLVMEMDSVDLFSSVGIPHGYSFLSEFTGRIYYQLFPSPPRYRDLGEVFYIIFPQSEDVLWLSRLDPQVVTKFIGLITESAPAAGALQEKYSHEIRESMVFLCVQAQAQMLNPLVRERLPYSRPRESAFYNLERVLRNFLASFESGDPENDPINEYKNLSETVQLAFSELEHIHQQSDQLGVSIHLVFALDRVEKQLQRIMQLAGLLFNQPGKKRRELQFFIDLVESSSKRHDISDLFKENLAALAKRITERNAEVGELYITRTAREYLAILKKALGGGLIIGFAATFKALTEFYLYTSYFWSGFLTSINYSISFTAIQLSHSTLATKQPAMTATALSSKMEGISDPQKEQELLDEVVHLIRSQIASILGNAIAVIPTVGLLTWGLFWLYGGPILEPAAAHKIIDKYHIIGPTPLFACFTGILLWLSSVFAGWVDNWAAYRRICDTIEFQGKILQRYSVESTKRLADFLRKNIAGLGGNISLGFLLGLSPKFFGFFGIPLDVRHVTISSGIVSFAVFNLPSSEIQWLAIGYAAIGLFVAGLCNVGVSFFCALFVAIWAKDLKTTTRLRIYRRIAFIGLLKPWRFLLPPLKTK